MNWPRLLCTSVRRVKGMVSLTLVCEPNVVQLRVVRGTPPGGPAESFYIGSSSPDGGSVFRSVIVSDPSIQIPHVKKSAAIQWPHREITGPQNTQNWHHFTQTSSSTHSNYLCLLTLLHLVLLSSFSIKNDVLITGTRIEFSNHENKQSLTQTFYLLLAAALHL